MPDWAAHCVADIARCPDYVNAACREPAAAARLKVQVDCSPAKSAGLQPGDQIIRYGGERFFNVLDLNRATLAGRPGETVLVDLRWDGTSFQETMPRGPLGIRGR